MPSDAEAAGASQAMVGEETGGGAVHLGAFLAGAKKLLSDRRSLQNYAHDRTI